jgi:hypothetical protein
VLSERTKVKALSEELENPMNVHRWRKLEGSDPGTLEMIQKIQTLQKRLIAKTEEVVEKDLLIQEKDKLYLDLKNILARQPGPEVAEQLSIYQQNLRDKTQKMKAMASELNMCVFPRFLRPAQSRSLHTEVAFIFCNGSEPPPPPPPSLPSPPCVGTKRKSTNTNSKSSGCSVSCRR